MRYQGYISCKDWHSKGQKCYGNNRSKRCLRRAGKNTMKNYTKKIFMTQITMGRLDLDILECKVKLALGSITMTKLVEVMEFQLSYFKS